MAIAVCHLVVADVAGNRLQCRMSWQCFPCTTSHRSIGGGSHFISPVQNSSRLYAIACWCTFSPMASLGFAGGNTEKRADKPVGAHSTSTRESKLVPSALSQISLVRAGCSPAPASMALIIATYSAPLLHVLYRPLPAHLNACAVSRHFCHT